VGVTARHEKSGDPGHRPGTAESNAGPTPFTDHHLRLRRIPSTCSNSILAACRSRPKAASHQRSRVRFRGNFAGRMSRGKCWRDDRLTRIRGCVRQLEAFSGDIFASTMVGDVVNTTASDRRSAAAGARARRRRLARRRGAAGRSWWRIRTARRRFALGRLCGLNFGPTRRRKR